MQSHLQYHCSTTAAQLQYRRTTRHRPSPIPGPPSQSEDPDDPRSETPRPSWATPWPTLARVPPPRKLTAASFPIQARYEAAQKKRDGAEEGRQGVGPRHGEGRRRAQDEQVGALRAARLQFWLHSVLVADEVPAPRTNISHMARNRRTQTRARRCACARAHMDWVPHLT